MDIIVCIKQVPDTEHLGEVKIDSQTNTLRREEVPAIINPFDENAIEEALRLREKHGGKVTVISMGPPQTKDALKSALAMGADEAILISDREFAGSDTLATSYTLAQVVRKIGAYDLILLGKQAIDGDTAQVGPELAEHLGLPQVTYVRRVEIKEKKIVAERVLEDSFEVVETSLPAVITVTKDINEPRYASLRGLLMARKKEIPIWEVKDLDIERDKVGLEGSPTQVIKVFTPTVKHEGKMLKGTVEEMVDQLINCLREKRII